MEEKERAEKDLRKLEAIIDEFKRIELDKRFPSVLEWAENYMNDAKHFFEKTDYFTSFGAANYAYGIIDGILIAEGRK